MQSSYAAVQEQYSRGSLVGVGNHAPVAELPMEVLRILVRQGGGHSPSHSPTLASGYPRGDHGA